MNRRILQASLAVAVALAPRAATADDATRDACFDAYEQAQRARNAGKLPDARARLLVCVDEACPAFVRKDCGAWLEQVQAEIAASAARTPPAPEPRPAPAPPAPEPAAPQKPWLLRLPAPSYVLGGVALLGLASFAGFALAGESVQACAPDCSSTQVSALRRDYLLADVSLVGALAAAAGAVTFALTSSTEATGAAPAPPRATSWWLGLRFEARSSWLGAGAALLSELRDGAPRRARQWQRPFAWHWPLQQRSFTSPHGCPVGMQTAQIPPAHTRLQQSVSCAQK